MPPRRNRSPLPFLLQNLKGIDAGVQGMYKTYKTQITKLLDELWDCTDSAGLRLINAESMDHVWGVQQKHLPCIQDPPGIDLYTTIGSLEKGGKVLNVFKCVRNPRRWNHSTDINVLLYQVIAQYLVLICLELMIIHKLIF